MASTNVIVRRGPLVIALLAAAYLGGWLSINLQATAVAGIVDSIFFRGSDRLDLASLNSAWGDVERDYVVRGVAAGDGTAGAERGIVDMLHSNFHDRFSAFFTKDQLAALHAGLNGVRTGSIGIAIDPRCAGATRCASGADPTELVIEDVLRGQPADRAGIRSGDVLVAVDSHAVDGLPGTAADRAGEVAPLVRGPAGKPVTLTVVRAGVTRKFSPVRADLRIPSVFTTRLGPALYVQVTGFETGTGSEAVAALKAGLAGGATAVVLDLRGNGGGYVSAAQTLASQFLTPRPGTEEAVVVRRGRMAASGDPATAQSITRDPILPGGVAPTTRLAVLIDGNSASASEIVAAALHDYHRAILVGEKSFGKGSVQIDFGLPDGNDLHLTVEKWYGPAGESIDLAGIVPDRPVALPDPETRFELDSQSGPPEADPQLQAALAAVEG